jgi:hypothetical protein
VTPNTATPAVAGIEGVADTNQVNEHTPTLSQVGPAQLEHAWITAAGSLIYKCTRCRRQHGHGAAGDRIGDVVHRVTHCHLGNGESVALLITGDERKAARERAA